MSQKTKSQLYVEAGSRVIEKVKNDPCILDTITIEELLDQSVKEVLEEYRMTLKKREEVKGYGNAASSVFYDEFVFPEENYVKKESG